MCLERDYNDRVFFADSQPAGDLEKEGWRGMTNDSNVDAKRGER